MDLLGRFGPAVLPTPSADPATTPATSASTADPAAPTPVGLEDALAYVRGLALGHYENFSVLSRLVPEDLRDDFAAVYAFCRWADDLGDETGPGDAARERSRTLLAWWRDQTRACWDGRAAHPVMVALRRSVERHHLPITPFLDLIDAFEQDQRVTRYDTWDQLLDYCRRSANPVG
ncbi:MAG: squalene/phytoene synthase family protein, partial [Phycisphaerae bacterium]|nr:squalene/phytoene synthase family protein [Phycisphaerae bacterium]